MKIKFLKIAILMLVVQSCAILTNSNKDTSDDSKETDKIWGIDISHYQEVVDWGKLFEQEPGFIFVKATEGSTFQDPKYTEYYNTIRKLNIPVGSYHFFTYKSTGEDQAKNFLSIVKYQHGDLPLVLDAEFARKMPEKKIIIKDLLEFMAVIYTKTGRYPMIYCDYKYYLLYLKDSLPVKCNLWIVDYKRKPDCDWTFWQITEKYKIGGVKGNVDFNLFYGSKKKLKSLLY